MSHFSQEEHERGPDPAEGLPFLKAVKTVKVDAEEVARVREVRRIRELRVIRAKQQRS